MTVKTIIAILIIQNRAINIAPIIPIIINRFLFSLLVFFDSSFLGEFTSFSNQKVKLFENPIKLVS